MKFVSSTVGGASRKTKFTVDVPVWGITGKLKHIKSVWGWGIRLNVVGVGPVGVGVGVVVVAVALALAGVVVVVVVVAGVVL